MRRTDAGDFKQARARSHLYEKKDMQIFRTNAKKSVFTKQMPRKSGASNLHTYKQPKKKHE